MKKFLLLVFISCLTLVSSYSQVEMVQNGTFEGELLGSDGYGYYTGSTAITALDDFRVDSVAYKGTYSARIFDHTWGVYLWNDVPGYTDNCEYTVSFWYKGEEPIQFSLFIGRDLGYDLGTDPEGIVGTGTVQKDKEIENAKIIWVLPKTAEWTKFTYTFRMGDWLGTDPETGDPISGVMAFMWENTSFAADDGASSYVDNMSILKIDLTPTGEMVKNGTFEGELMGSDGYGYYTGSTTITALDDFRVDAAAYEGNYSARIFDHTWGVYLWNDVPGYTDNAEYAVSFWYKGEEPIQFSLFIGRDLGYDLGTDPDGIVGTGTVQKDKEIENAKIIWKLPKTAEWTKFTYTFTMGAWLGNDPETGDPISGVMAFMWENTSFAADDGANSYVDNMSIIKTEGASSINNIDYNTIHIFPNPASDYIYLTGLNNTANLQIFTTTGQLIEQIKQFNGQPINITDYHNGVYFIKAANSIGDQYVGKFIKK